MRLHHPAIAVLAPLFASSLAAAAPTPAAPTPAAPAPTSAAPAPAAASHPAPGAPAEPDAKPDAERRFSFDVAPAVVVPVGNLSDGAGVGFGGFVGLRRPVLDRLDVTARAGFVYHLAKDYGAGSVGISEVPVLGGVRYTFVPSADGGFYGAAELGLSIVFARATGNTNALIGAQTVSASDTKASTTLGLGYQLGKLDVRGALYFIDLGHMGDSMTVMASVGYAFAQL